MHHTLTYSYVLSPFSALVVRIPCGITSFL